MPPPRCASIPRGFLQVPGTRCRCLSLLAFLGVSLQVPGTRCRCLGLLAFLGVSVRCQAPVAAASRHPLPLPRFASVPRGFRQVPGTRCRCLGLLAFPKGFPQVPGTRCRYLGLLAFLKGSLQVPGTRCRCLGLLAFPRGSLQVLGTRCRCLGFCRMFCNPGKIGALAKVYSGGLRSPLARVQSPRRAFSSVE